jgi:hypothetical protein
LDADFSDNAPQSRCSLEIERTLTLQYGMATAVQHARLVMLRFFHFFAARERSDKEKTNRQPRASSVEILRKIAHRTPYGLL